MKVSSHEVLEILVHEYNENARAAALFRAADHPASAVNGARADVVRGIIEKLFERGVDWYIGFNKDEMAQFHFEWERIVIL